jgi:general secretion pathway protein D
VRRVGLRLLPRWPGILAALLALAVASCIAKPGVDYPRLAASHGDARGPQTVRHGAEGASSTRRGFFWRASGRDRAEAPRPARPGAALVSESGEGVTLNLVEAPIADAAKAVLGDILGVNYVIDGRVSGAVTVQTTSPVTRTALLDVFDAVLTSQGAGMVVEGDLHEIVPANQVASSGAQLRVRGDGRPLGPGTSIYAVPLTHVSAGEMRELLASVSPDNAIVHAGGPGNVLIVAGTRAEIIAMLEVVDVFDVDEMRGMSFAMFPVQAADPQAVAGELDTLFGNASDSGYQSVIRFVPNRRLRAVLAMSTNADYLRQADEMLLHLDAMSQASARELFSYKARNRPAAELADILVQIYGAAGGPLAEDRPDRGLVASPARDGGGTGSTGRSPALADSGSAEAPIPAGFSTGEGARERPGSFSGEGGGGLGPPVSVVADNANRMLLITATRDEYTRIAGILDRIDLPPDQVLLEATIAEVTLNDELRYGLRWFFQDGEKRRQFTFTDLLVGAVAPTFPGFSYFFNGINTQIALDALSAVTDVNIVSSPTLTVLDGRRAVLQVGDEVPIITQQVTGVENPNAPLVNSVNYRNTGIILNIVPTIQERGRVVLEIEQEVSEVGATTSSTINSPTIQQRRIATTVVVDDGESLAIGGLMQDRSSRGRDQVPILGDVPLVGNLFKSKRDTVRRTELLIVMTPRIVRDTNQVRQIAEEFRGKLNFSLRHQRQRGPTLVEQLDRLQR